MKKNIDNVKLCWGINVRLEWFPNIENEEDTKGYEDNLDQYNIKWEWK